ncbi:DUF92 domain-containing protein [Bacillus salacetis]|uniref:DUF92 domain-containing protein n=1 Tax=Bacillus salacetis TaxID=2315464 RepID=A0A3A1QU31_9BACI|nr:DUF92 domain-containing protein [Bacillus salacetis]RIW31057.1 DUF92 domain-containing protein [Bacillus salacetis]
MNDQFVFQLFIILAVSLAGWSTNNLNRSGALAAVVTGTAISWAFGWKGLLVLGVFFGTSSFWSKYKSSSKSGIEKKLAKTSKRDWQQVLANGGSAVIFSLLYIGTNEVIFLAGMCASLSAANADTWASEIGTLSKRNPVSVRTWKSVERGTSGAVSFLGLIASLGGAAIIGWISSWVFHELDWQSVLLIISAGFFGSLIDTLLGAFIQMEYKCIKCDITTEASSHCGVKCKKEKGAYLVNNEFVNFAASLLAGSAAAILM